MGPPCTPGQQEAINPMCPVTDWSAWSPCSTTCGPGISTRTRFLLADPAIAEKCKNMFQVQIAQTRQCSEKADCSFDISTAKGIFLVFYLHLKYINNISKNIV